MAARRGGLSACLRLARRRLLLLLTLALLLTPSAALGAQRRLRKSAQSAAVFCADVGVEISFPSRDVQAAMDELREEDGVEGERTSDYRPQSCLRSALMSAITGHMKTSLRKFAVSALDCVPEPLDWETSTVAMFAVTSVCSRSNMEVGANVDAWTADLKKELDQLFQLSSGHQQRIQLAKTTGMLRQVALSKSYTLPEDGNGVPVLDLQTVRLWSEGEEETDENDDSFFTYVELNIDNTGTIPLHLFRVTVAKEAPNLVNLAGVEVSPAAEVPPAFVFPLVNPAVVEPGASATINFKTVTTRRVNVNAKYKIYISHTGFRAHIFDGMLLEDKTLAFEKPAINRESLRVDDGKENVFSRFSMESGLLESQFPAFPFAFWQVGSIGIALVVGICVTMFFLRRKFRGLYYLLCSCCPCVSSRKTASKRTKSTRSKKVTSSSRTSTASSTSSMTSSEIDEYEAAIEMKRLTDATSPVETTVKTSNAPLQPSRPRLQVKAPEISLNRKSPKNTRSPMYASPAMSRNSKSATEEHAKPSPSRRQRQQQQQVQQIAAAPQPLNLDCNARLDPQQFESMWDEYAQRFQGSVPGASSPSEASLVANMENVGVSCMASGTINGVNKYVFYAKEQAINWFYLIAIDVTTATSSVTITVRTSRDAADSTVQQLIELVLATIAKSVSS